MRVAVSHRVAEDISVFVYIYKVASPGVNTDALDVNATLRHEFQTFDNLKVECVDIPIEVTACFDKVVVEAGQLL